jgi:hypothetical protein
MINPATYNFTIYTSKSINLTFTYGGTSPVNLTGYTARCYFRNQVTDPNPIIMLSSGSGITLGTTNGQITIAATPIQTALFVGFKTAIYDLELTDASGNVFTLLSGTCQIVESVTR